MKKSTDTKVQAIKTDDAKLEAYAPQALVINGEDFVIRACDGDEEYMYLAVKRKTTYLVTEVYPGLAKKETHVREAYELKDLTFSSGKHKTIEAVVTELRAVIFEGFEFEGKSVIVTPPPGHGVPALRAVNG